MRCMCSGKSKSYAVTSVKTSTPRKTHELLQSSAQNGISASLAQENRQATTTQIPSTNGIETTQTTTQVQVHNNHNDEATRYQDTSKTVAKEFTSTSTSKSSTPEGTLKKSRAPQPKTSQNQVTFQKTSEIHIVSPESIGVTKSSHQSSQSKSEMGSSDNLTSSHSAIVEESSHNMSSSQSNSVTSVAESSHNMILSQSASITEPPHITISSHETSVVKTSPNISIAESSHNVTSIENNSASIVEPFHIMTSSQEASVLNSPPSTTTSDSANVMELSHNITSSHSASLTESSHLSTKVTQETTSSTVTGSKSETNFLKVHSSTNTSTKISPASSTEDLSSSTALESSESLENLSIGRKESVGELLAGSNRSSASLENEVRRRSGVQVSVLTGPEVTSEEELPFFKKSPDDEEKIRKAIEKNEFLSKILSGKRLQDIINAMQPKNVIAKQKLIKQGEKGSEMFVSKEGTFKILIKGKVVGEFRDNRVFGELAILYNAKRLASIQAATTGKVWVLDRHVYQKIVISSNLKEQDENLKFLQNVESLNVVDVEVLRQVSNLLKPEFFVSGTVIIRQGDKGDKFYIIRAGTVTISKTGEGILGKLGKGQCFGEMALQKEDTRQATVTAEAPGVECLTLTRADFINHFGDVEIPKIEVKKTSFKDDAPSEYQDIKLEDLKIIKTLGVGGFGRVELVQHKKKKDLIFALKYLKKIDIVYQNQQEHVYNEKLIQMNSRSPFIARLYRTYKDNKYVYFLMESCLGGDLFSLLHKQKGKRFEEKDAKFLSACVLEALEHLHSKGVVYRDLKPENLLIDKNGYLKLTDFGFAKKMPARGKTFTFAGTPEYVAPEIVLNRGHDKAVDYWAFGAFIFELLTGRTPFRTGDSSHMRTYNKILNGIDNVNFPTYMNPKARNLIEKLCRPVPSERMGMQRGGTRDIKAHKWYLGFDWVKFQQCQIPSSFKPKLKDVIDTTYFDLFKQDKDYPPDETSGWDIHF